MICPRFSLLSKRDIDIAFDFVVDFDTAEEVSMQTASMTSGSGQANVDSYVLACKCDDFESFTCNTTPLTPNTILNVCIQSMDADVEIAFLNNLQLFQSNALGDETLAVVDGLLVQNPDISAVTIKNNTAVGVATVVPSRFFSYGGESAATVSGIVTVKFVGPSARRLASFSLGGRPMSKVVASTRGLDDNTEFDLYDYDGSLASAREMREDDMAQVSDEAEVDEEDAQEDEEEEASPFEITVGLERDLIEIPATKSGYHNSSGSVVVEATSSVGAAIAVCLATMFAW